MRQQFSLLSSSFLLHNNENTDSGLRVRCMICTRLLNNTVALQGNGMTYPISTYCYYRTKYHISQENFRHFVQYVEKRYAFLGNTHKARYFFVNYTQNCVWTISTFAENSPAHPTLLIIYQQLKKVNTFLKNHHFTQIYRPHLCPFHKPRFFLRLFSVFFWTYGHFSSSWRYSSGTLFSTIEWMTSQLQLLAVPMGE